MSTNRLNLDWKLTLRSERTQFIQDYIQAIPFTPTNEEMEMMGNYILWGKLNTNEKDGPSRLKNEGLYISTRNNDWLNDHVESLDALIETPGFSETQLRSLQAPPTKKIRKTFSRDEARKLASPEVLQALESLWQTIDKLELIIAYYDLAHHRRTAPIREPLLNRFTSTELSHLQEYALSLKQYNYFKLKHQLVDLRQQQYAYQDTYKTTLLPHTDHIIYQTSDPIEFGDEITILPLGLAYDTPIHNKLFQPNHFPIPSDFSQDELTQLSTILWRRAPQHCHYFDFSNPQHLYQLYTFYQDITTIDEPSESLQLFIKTAETYQSLAKLDPIQQEILQLKIQQKTNQEISDLIYKKYGHKYQLNYISTLYCKKILPTIAETARYHREVCENLFFPENFKQCKDCGNTFLLDERNWTRRKRSNDGFAPRCKSCDKIKRNGGK